MYACPAIPTILTQKPSFALWPGGQQVIEARGSKDLGVMDAAWELGHMVCKDVLVVTGGLNIQAVEVVVIMVYLQLRGGGQ